MQKRRHWHFLRSFAFAPFFVRCPSRFSSELWMWVCSQFAKRLNLFIFWLKITRTRRERQTNTRTYTCSCPVTAAAPPTLSHSPALQAAHSLTLPVVEARHADVLTLQTKTKSKSECDCCCCCRCLWLCHLRCFCLCYLLRLFTI